MIAPRVLWETLRHLCRRQIGSHIARRFLPARQSTPLPLCWRSVQPQILRSKNSPRVFFDGGSRFNFNNETRTFSGGWNDPTARKLWLYNLHYMTWIFDLQEGRESWILKWIRENPRASGGNGWEPYPLSLRLFNWCKHFSLSGTVPDPEVLESMGQQVSSLLAKLEFHLDGNHLLENLLALAFAGSFLDAGDFRTAKPRVRIQTLLETELSKQFLSDGGHYELSPMYHSILLERLLDLLNLRPVQNDAFPGLNDKVRTKALGALDWLDVMSIGGRFALFNDSAYDTAPEAAMLLEYGTRLLGFQPRPRTHLRLLPASGYFRAETGPFTLIFDVGKLGPDHQMGHAQGDMLSFCLWMKELPLIVHPGNFEYVNGSMRDYCRSTASHNTLVVEGGEQAEWWASHRVGWRGHPSDVKGGCDPVSGAVQMRGSHNGFSRLPRHPMHMRKIEMTGSSVIIRDSLSPDPGRESRIYFHFHPDCSLEQMDGGVRIQSAVGNLILRADKPMTVEDSWYCPEFGLRMKNRAIVVECRESACTSALSLEV